MKLASKLIKLLFFIFKINCNLFILFFLQSKQVYKCKECNYYTQVKEEWWEHLPIHIPPEKRLCCPFAPCKFITKLKHHMDYHVKNHTKVKPFKCEKCSYTCVNKSMLNSHLKSHSNVYQYTCSNCAYASKHQHTMKMHLRKYNHNPGPSFNADGSPNPNPIDVKGRRRGPRKVNSRAEELQVNGMQPMPLMQFGSMNQQVSLGNFFSNIIKIYENIY